MASESSTEVSTIFEQLKPGDADAKNRLLNEVYDDLKKMAGDFMRAERSDHSWQKTELAHEAVVRLLGGPIPLHRKQFFAAVSATMRRLLVEHARLRKALKRKGKQRVPLDVVEDYFAKRKLHVDAVREAIDDLATFDLRQSQVVTWHYICRFTVQEIAEMLEMSRSTVESDLRLAKAWLRTQLKGTR